MNELIKRQTVDSMCEAYQTARKEVDEAFRLMFSATERLKIFNDHPYIFGRNMTGSPSEYDVEESRKIMKREAWRSILNHTQIREWCSAKQAKEFDDQLEKGDLPDLTTANVFKLIENLSGNLDSMFKEAMQEVFDFLRPGRWQSYKTNNKFEVGPKVIISWGMDTSYGMCRVVYGKERYYQALDNVFHLLDGKGVAKYPTSLPTRLNEAARNKEWSCETEYFKCKWYKKGTLHIEFKRLDLVKELNKRAGGMNFKGEAA